MSAQRAPPEDDGIDLFAGAMPKEEIGALAFLKEHPEYDGRGVVVAIFDTGVDPGAFGLQETTDGKPKIIDVIDCTGSGDVDTSTVVKADADGTIPGLYGNKLRLNPDWVNPTGEWRVGAKRAEQLFANGLRRRMKDARRRRWDEKQRAATTAASSALAQFTCDNPGQLTEDKKKAKEDLEARIKLLADLAEKYEDPGPLLDCVVWHDGTYWLAAIDTSEMYEEGSGAGLLADFKPMTNFEIERQYATFSAEDACNFACNIYEAGRVLSIVVDAGAHGTHVAGITAAYHPKDPSLNGIAPGAQIISCKIGDTRLGSMETGVGLTRGLIAVLEHKADLINMSYGEATATPNQGRFVALANEVVNKHGVIFVSSAGNAGPALSTVGAPGGTSSSILAIGAYISPELAAAGHSVRLPPAEGQQYTWSSRGPTPDGHQGVVLSAPGGAIAPVPQWTQQSRQLMNGTSMASPNACGGVALVLSGLKAAGLTVTPNRVRRALENTCEPLGGDAADAVLTYGRGLIQVHKAFEYLQKSEANDQPDMRYEVTARRSDSQATQRGIYMREPLETAGPVSFACEVLPKLHEDADTVSERLAVEDKLHLSSTAAWVACPSALLLPHGGRGFEVRVDPSQLAEGLHYAEVVGVDSKAPWRGPLFRLPITVIKPLRLTSSPDEASTSGRTDAAPHSGNNRAAPEATNGNSSSSTGNQASQAGGRLGPRRDYVARLGQIAFTAGREVRRFVEVPEGAAWAEMRIRADEHDTPRSFMVRATQLLPHTRYSDSEARSFVSLAAHAEYTLNFKVVAAATLEITLGQLWSSLGDATLDVQLSFHGLQTEPAGAAFLDGAAGVTKVAVRSPFRVEKVNPGAKLTHVRIPLRPAETQLAPLLDPRDALPEGRVIHSLMLTYKLSVAEAGKHKPTLPMLNKYVYDGELEAQMFMLFDANKRQLAVGDIYPEPVQLKKGDYTIRVHLRHDDVALLEKLRGMPLVVERKLADDLKLPVYASNSDAVKGAKPVKESTLYPGERVAYFLGAPTEDKLPKDVTPGRVLTGSLVLAKATKQAGGGDAPTTLPICYCVPPKKESSSDNGKEEEEKKSAQERLADAVRDAQVKLLKDLKTDTPEAEAEYAALLKQLLAEHPQHLPLLLEPLKRLDGLDKEKRTAKLQDIVAAADAVIKAIDTDALALYVAQKCAEEGTGAAKRKRENDERKAALVEALEKKCAALLQLYPSAPSAAPAAAEPAEAPAEPAGPSGQELADPFEAAFAELRKWADTAEGAGAVLHAKREARAGRLASALKALDKASDPDDKPATKEVLQLRAELFQQLGWPHWQQYEETRIKDYFPPAFPLF
ncbi:hypothetical protein WJX72_008467 [[Myrmecia] bisecta]|uniref:tripeptidyl-peptidase II n=1 Tax=[Myrmecia] bisecta TaxID=41462 RepID=A0AAW1PM49_9CHLO